MTAADPAPSLNRVLSERILGRLPGPRVIWILAWGATAIGMNRAVNALAPESSSVSILEAEPLGVGITVYGIVLSLWAARYLSERADRLEGLMKTLVIPGAKLRWLDGIGSTGRPILVASLITALEAAGLLGSFGFAYTLVLVPLQFVVHLPLAVGVWVVLTILVSMDRLGRVGLSLDASSGDPTLGLSPVGKLAVQAFAVFAAGAVPILLANTDSLLAVGINGGVFLIGAGAFLVSLWHVHRQMVSAREVSISEARRRLAAVSERIEAAKTSEPDERDAAMLTVADLLERRAREIRTWPLTGGLYGQLGAILFAVLVGLTTRAISTSLGL